MLRVVAALGTDLADQAAHPSIRLRPYVETTLEQQIEAADAIPAEGYAVRAYITGGELHNQPRVAFSARLSLSLRHGVSTQARRAQEEEKPQDRFARQP